MADLAELSVKITTDVGDSTANLDSFSKTADRAADSAANLSNVASKSSDGVLASGMSAQRSATQLSDYAKSMSIAEQNTMFFLQRQEEVNKSAPAWDRFHESVIKIPPATEEVGRTAAESTTHVNNLAIHMARLGYELENGHVSFRATIPLMREFLKLSEELATAVGLVGGAFVAAGIAAAGYAAALLAMRHDLELTATSAQDMAKGVATGTGITAEGFNHMAEEAANKGQITIKQAQEIGKEILKSGNIGAEGLQSMTEAVAGVAKKMGGDLPEAQKLAAEGMKDPIKGIKDLQERMHTYDGDIQDNIESLVRQGKVTQAAAVFQKEFEKAAEGASKGGELMGGVVAQAFEKVKQTMTSMAEKQEDSIGRRAIEKYIDAQEAAQKLAKDHGTLGTEAKKAADESVDAAKKEAAAIVDTGKEIKRYEGLIKEAEQQDAHYNAGFITAAQKRIQALKEVQAQHEKTTKEEKDTSALQQLEKSVDDTVSKFVKQSGAMKDIEDRLIGLNDLYQKNGKFTEDQAHAVQNLIAQYNKLRDEYYGNTDAANKNSSANDNNKKKVDEVAQAHASLTSAIQRNTQQWGQRLTALNSSLNAENSYTSAMQNHANAIANLNSAHESEIRALNASTEVLNKNAQAKQNLANATADLNNPLRDEVIHTNAVTKESNDLIQALQGRADAYQTLNGPHAAEIQQLKAETNAINEVNSASQQEADTIAKGGETKAQAATKAEQADRLAADMANEKARKEEYAAQMAKEDEQAQNRRAAATERAAAADRDAAQAAAAFGDSMGGVGGGGSYTPSVAFPEWSGIESANKAAGGAASSMNELSSATDKASGKVDAFSSALSSLQDQAKSLTKVIEDAANMKRPEFTAKEPAIPDVSAGATSSRAPGAYGGDKNASFFYDPNSRETFLAQFGIIGNAETQRAERAYQLQLQQYQQAVQQYQAEVAAYNAAQEAARQAQAQLAGINAQIAALNAWQSIISGTLKDIYKNPGQVERPNRYPGGAAGGEWMVQGSPETDSNLVSMRLTAGELVSVKTPEQQKASIENSGNNVVYLTINTPDVQSFKNSRSQIVNRVSSMISQATKNRG